jgi:Transposase DDE domain group 1
VLRHGKLPGVRIADKTLDGVTCIRLDATVTFAHSDKELAEPDFKGFGHHPLMAFCDNTGGEPLSWMLRAGSAGSNTTADHLKITDAAIAALPPWCRRKLMVTVDGAGASHGLIEHLDTLASRRGYELTYPVGRALGDREKTAIRLVPEQGREIAVDGKGEVRERRSDGACADAQCGHRACWIEEAHVTELTGLLREGPGGDQLDGWPATMRVFARRERPHPGAKLTLMEAGDGWRYTLRVTNLPAKTKGWRGRTAYIDAGHRIHARVEGAIRTGKDTGLGHFPSHDFKISKAWLTAAMTAQTLLAWLKLLALDGDLARAEPSRKPFATGFSTQPPASCAAHAANGSRSPRTGPGPRRSPRHGSVSTPSRNPPDQRKPVPATCGKNPGPVETPGTRPASRANVIPER